MSVFDNNVTTETTLEKIVSQMRKLILDHFPETANYCEFDSERIANVFSNLFYSNHIYTDLVEKCDYCYPKILVHNYIDYWNVNITVAVVGRVNQKKNVLWISGYDEILSIDIPSKSISHEKQNFSDFDPGKWEELY